MEETKPKVQLMPMIAFVCPVCNAGNIGPLVALPVESDDLPDDDSMTDEMRHQLLSSPTAGTMSIPGHVECGKCQTDFETDIGAFIGAMGGAWRRDEK